MWKTSVTTGSTDEQRRDPGIHPGVDDPRAALLPAHDGARDVVGRRPGHTTVETGRPVFPVLVLGEAAVAQDVGMVLS